MRNFAFLFSVFILFVALSCTGHDDKFHSEESVNDNSVKEENQENQEEMAGDDSTSEETQEYGNYNYLALGDSYTIGESVKTEERFPVQLSEELTKNGFNIEEQVIIARTGWTTDELASAIESRNLEGNFDLVTLLIGVNNQYRGLDSDEYRTQFAELLQTAIQFAGKETNVIVVSIPDYGVTPFGQNINSTRIAEEIDLYNRINLEETQKTEAQYVNITEISRQAKNDKTLVASDGLHPSGKMYSLWVEEILPVAKQILEKSN